MPLAPSRQPQPIRLIHWGDFQISMLSNPAYMRVSQAVTDQRVVSRIELYFSMHVENWPLIAQLWGGMIATCPVGALPTALELEQWNSIASANYMPFQFNEEGQLMPM